MTRTMYDAIDALALPAGGDLYAGYVDGRWPSANAITQRFPHATVVRIAVSANTDDGVVLDCEPGNCTPEEAVGWVLMRRRAGADPTVYCNQHDPVTGWPAVRAAFQARAVPEPHYWVADYSPSTAIPAGAVALQHTNTGPYDVSSVADYWPGVDPAPIPPAHQVPAQILLEGEMRIIRVTGQEQVYMLSGGLLWHIQSVEALEGWIASGVEQATVPLAELEHIAARIGVAVSAL